MHPILPLPLISYSFFSFGYLFSDVLHPVTTTNLFSYLCNTVPILDGDMNRPAYLQFMMTNVHTEDACEHNR